jgi:Ni,Fe-hydrogenase maturation factor
MRDGADSFPSLFLGLVEHERRAMTNIARGVDAAMLLHSNGFSQVLRATEEERTIELPAQATLIGASSGIENICGALSEQAHAGLDELVKGVIDVPADLRGKNVGGDMAVLAVRFGDEG